MDPLRSLAQSLAHRFSDPRLAQLFARYATYIGGLPQASPALTCFDLACRKPGGLACERGYEAIGLWHGGLRSEFGR